jgi:cyclic dipeptide N-dimethylallyltransferase
LTEKEAQNTYERHDFSKIPFKTQNALAVDLTKTGITMKLYLYPPLKAALSGTPSWKATLKAIRDLDKDGQFADSAAVVETHMLGQPSTVALEFMSCDLVPLEKTRFKLYILDHELSFDRMVHHWTLGGRLMDEDRVIGMKMLRELWDGFKIPVGKREPLEGPSKPGDPPLLPLFLNYELISRNPFPASKVYFPLTGIPDMAVAQILTAFFERHGFDEQAKTFIDNLKMF